MKWWQNFKKKCALEYIETLKPTDTSDKERFKFKVEVNGERLDDLIDPPEKIRFSSTEFLEKSKEAEDYGKIQWNEGHEVEIWELIKRWK